MIASAYNAGASRVEKWLARANGKLAMDEFIASIPFFETRGYVQNVFNLRFLLSKPTRQRKITKPLAKRNTIGYTSRTSLIV